MEKTYRIYFWERPGFRFATSGINGMYVSEDKKFFYSDFTVTANYGSHQIITALYGGVR